MDKIIAGVILFLGFITTIMVALFIWALRIGVFAGAAYIVYKIGTYLFTGAW